MYIPMLRFWAAFAILSSIGRVLGGVFELGERAPSNKGCDALKKRFPNLVFFSGEANYTLEASGESPCLSDANHSARKADIMLQLFGRNRHSCPPYAFSFL